MKFKDILDYAVYQCGSMGSDEWLNDLENDAQTLIKGYVNEWYRIMTRDYWKPYEIEQTVLDGDGRVDTSTLSKRYLALLGTARTKEELEYGVSGAPALNPLNQRLSTDADKIAIGEPNATVWIRYAYLYPDLANDTDEPEVPSQYHTLLCDYATWRYMSTGNQDKQVRAQFFYGRWFEGISSIRPFGEKRYTLDRFRNLFTR